MTGAMNSPIFAHMASRDLEELGHIFARAYLRSLSSAEAQPKHAESANGLDQLGGHEPSCARATKRAKATPMMIEPNGSHVCATHASTAGRRLTANEVLDVRAETGCKPRCSRCLVMDVSGHVACGEHAPGLGSDSWTADQWGPIPMDELAEFQRHGIHPSCSACDASARNCA